MNDPVLKRLKAMLAKAEKTEPEYHDAACLATADAKGRPSARVVLARHVDDRGVAFFTNYKSRKGSDLGANPWACLNFHWKTLHAQVRISGKVRLLPEDESDAYFAGRPRLSRIGAWGSRQSEVIANRGVLLARCAAVTARYGKGDIPRPPHWGGYLLEPTEIEFWQEGAWRLHKRERFTRHQKGWKRVILSP